MAPPRAQQSNRGGAEQKRRARKKRRRRQRKKKRELKLIDSAGFDDLRLYLIAKRMAKEAREGQKAKLKPMPEKLVFPYVKTIAEERRKKQAADEIAAQMAGLSLS